MNNKVIKINTIIGLICQIITLILQFIFRNVFLNYLGIELLGISSTFTSIISTITLAELGVSSAIVFSLYKPITENNHILINKIISTYKFIYRIIGFFILVAGFLVLPFIGYILKDVSLDKNINVNFALTVVNASATYLFSYRRCLLYADQKDYISKISDSVFNILFNVAKILAVVSLKNYHIVLLLTIMQTIASNLFLHILCKKKYVFLNDTGKDKETLDSIFANVRHLFVGKIAYYIYTSTDNILISLLVNTIMVGYVANYVTVFTNVKLLVASLLNPLTPIVGNYLQKNRNKEENIAFFDIYTEIRCFIAGLLACGSMIVINDIITLWVGKEYIINGYVVFLLVVDLYLFVIAGQFATYVDSAGLFQKDKYIELIRAITNIVLSIILGNKYSLVGIYIGTIVSQIMFWVGRCVIVYKYCLHAKKNMIFRYFIYCSCNIFAVVIATIVLSFVRQKVIFSSSLVSFLTFGVLSVVVYITTWLLLFMRKSNVIKMIKKRKF